MNNSKSSYQNLYRRNGRRRSNPASPTSPVSTRRTFDRGPRQFDSFTANDEVTATEKSSSTSVVDPDTPRPKSATSSSIHEQATVAKPQEIDVPHALRRSEEQGIPLQLQNAPESARTPSSDGSENKRTTPQGRQNTQFEVLSRSSPIIPTTRRSEDKGSFSPEFFNTSPDIRLSNFRNFSTSAQGTERSFLDDSGNAKAGTAKRSRLNLLNPMSLLARRRSSHNQRVDESHLSVNTLPVPALPDDFNPSIRGNIVHDFSAPRTRRMYSHSDAIRQPSSPFVDGQRPSTDVQPVPDINSSPLISKLNSPPMPHNAAFKEHFQDDDKILQPGRTGYLQGLSAANKRDSSKLLSVPAFAKNLPDTVPDGEPDKSPTTPDRTQQQKQNGDKDHKVVSPRRTPPPPPPLKGPPSPRHDTPMPKMRKHMTSTSSRFSFYPGPAMQEKLLEEKHKQQAAAAKKTDSRNFDDDFNGDGYDDYDFDQDDGLEERIPGVNADYDDEEEDMFANENGIEDDDEEEIPTFDIDKPTYVPKIRTSEASSVQAASFQGFHFTPQSATFSPTTTYPPSQPTPRDHEGKAIGIASYGDFLQGEDDGAFPPSDLEDMPKVVSFLEGLGISTAPEVLNSDVSLPHPQTDEDYGDDLYFDDGEFDDEAVLDDDEKSFDERVFDDGNSQIPDLPARNAFRLEAASQMDMTKNLAEDIPVLHAQPSYTEPNTGQVVAGLTEGNLAAYHDALANAANQAAAKGRFDRHISFDKNSEDETSLSQYESSQPGQMSDRSFLDHGMGSSAIAEDDGFPFDDDLDDPLIAEANAEALENDEDGFYGTEFGFYARAHSKGSSQYADGGFFAARGSNGVKRSHSARNNFQEPSLTPITERSEWSTRNSVASFAHGGFPASAQSLPSPGIQQLLEMDSPAYDEDMSLSVLMKLRGRAFGGSSSSLNSIGPPHPISSPLAQLSSSNFMFSDHMSTTSRLASSIHSLPASAGIPESEEEDDEIGGWLPTLTQNTPRKRISERTPITPSPYSTSLPALTSEMRRAMHHRSGSGTDSVSYAQSGDGKWILERRRTSEDGNEQVIDREELAGMRI